MNNCNNLLAGILAVRRQLKVLAHRDDLPIVVRDELNAIQTGIKFMVNESARPVTPSNRFLLVEQEDMVRQAEAVTRTARDTLAHIMRQLDSLDFRVVRSEADSLMDTIAVNADNEKLSDADFREFIRNSIRPEMPKLFSADTDGIADNGPDHDGVELHQLSQPRKLYCTICGGDAKAIGYKQWVCESCHAPLGESRVTTSSKHHSV